MEDLHHCYLRATCCSELLRILPPAIGRQGTVALVVDVCSPLPALATMPRRLAQDAALTLQAVLAAWYRGRSLMVSG